VEVARRLEHNGYKCEFIMGDLPQSRRTRIIEDIKSGKIKYLVATDVAARGLHIDDLELVVNYDIPLEYENYVHRIGRTARVGKSGKAISLACDRYVYGLEAIEEFINMKIPVAWATDDIFVKDESAGKRISREIDDLKGGSRRQGTRRQPPRDRNGSSRRGPAPRKSAQSKTAAVRKPEHKKSGPERKAPQKTDRKRRDPKPATREERMAYYGKKYGENFKNAADRPSADQPPAAQKPARKSSLVQKILGRFAGKS
jgi:ATP-dependent RNA helicase RhlB